MQRLKTRWKPSKDDFKTSQTQTKCCDYFGIR